MKKPDTYWVVQITNTQTGQITHVMDKYGHRPERFYDRDDATRRMTKVGGKLVGTVFQSSVVEKSDAPHAMTDKEAKEAKGQVAAMRERMGWGQ